MVIIPLKDRNILRHELELKWIKLLQTPHPLGLNDNTYHEGNISRLPDLVGFFLFKKSVNAITDLMVNAKMET